MIRNVTFPISINLKLLMKFLSLQPSTKKIMDYFFPTYYYVVLTENQLWLFSDCLLLWIHMRNDIFTGAHRIAPKIAPQIKDSTYYIIKIPT